MHSKIIRVLLLALGLISVAPRPVHGYGWHLVAPNCTEVFSKTENQYVPYQETYQTRSWTGRMKWKVRTNYRKEERTVHYTKEVCCQGYLPYNSTLCRPVCTTKLCGKNEECVSPEKCECVEGYKFDTSVEECRPECSRECENGECVSPEVCACKEGYSPTADPTRCQPVCKLCEAHEECVEPGICKCATGWKREPLHPEERIESAPSGECRPICDLECVNSECVAPNNCECHDGYESFEDDAFLCQPKCSPACVFGNCTAPGTCTCHPGYEPTDLPSICQPVCSPECFNGKCVSPGICSCDEGYVNPSEEHPGECVPYCESNCPNGMCLSPGTCGCEEGYEKVTTAANSSSCAPACSHCLHGDCVAPEKCSCHEGYVQTSDGDCAPHCESNCPNGTCVSPGVCSCDEGYQSVNSTCEPVCTKPCIEGKCTAPDVCTCLEEGYAPVVDEEGAQVVCRPVCHPECLHGTCTAPGVCTCPEGYEKRNPVDEPHRCSVLCRCHKGYCNDTEPDSCESCLEGYELASELSSSSDSPLSIKVCVPRCKSNCPNGRCIEPEVCECDEYYRPVNTTETPPTATCEHVCGGDCENGGVCQVENATCACGFGWTGAHCQEASLCFIEASPDQLSNEYENLTSLEENWTGPSCDERCVLKELHEPEPSCYLQKEPPNIICFIDIESQCNYNHRRAAQSEEESSAYSPGREIYLGGFLVLLAVLAAVGATLFFVRRRRRFVENLPSANLLAPWVRERASYDPSESPQQTHLYRNHSCTP